MAKYIKTEEGYKDIKNLIQDGGYGYTERLERPVAIGVSIDEYENASLIKFYQVSPQPLDIDDIDGSSYINRYFDSQEFVGDQCTVEMWDEYYLQNGEEIVGGIDSGWYILTSFSGGTFKVGDIENNTITIPEPGVYFALYEYNSLPDYATDFVLASDPSVKISWDGSATYPDVVHKIDSKYLPDINAGIKTINEDGNMTDYDLANLESGVYILQSDVPINIWDENSQASSIFTLWAPDVIYIHKDSSESWGDVQSLSNGLYFEWQDDGAQNKIWNYMYEPLNMSFEEYEQNLGQKQDAIDDLATIRSGAALGTTALQSVPSTYALKTDLPTKTSDLVNDSGFFGNGDTQEADFVTLANVAISGSYNDLSDQPTIPSIDGLATEQYVVGYAEERQFTSIYQVQSLIENGVKKKQDTISDLSTIRSGAALGATAVQPENGKGLFSGNYNDLTNKPTIPTASDSVFNVEYQVTRFTDIYTALQNGKICVTKYNGDIYYCCHCNEDVIVFKFSGNNGDQQLIMCDPSNQWQLRDITHGTVTLKYWPSNGG